VYCALDREFSEPILQYFTTETTIRVDPRFDTEANKSVGLYQELIREADRPRCDVFWNNEILGTIRLQQQGLLEPFIPETVPLPRREDGPASVSKDTLPRNMVATDHTWYGFAARARVFIVNTELVSEHESPRSLFDLVEPKWKGKCTIAKPFFGTTATHMVCLFNVLGEDQATRFLDHLRANEVQFVAGNKSVAQRVARGDFAFGLTDTDDAILEANEGRPIRIIYPDSEGHKDYPRMGTLYLPNTVSIIKGAPHKDQAKRLAQTLLSQKVEQKLAEGGGYQIPLNPKAHVKLHPMIRRPESLRMMDVDFENVATKWESVQRLLRDKLGLE
jgi:iron(III) transport system substrate-binding protein